jgi:hypothetical protein
LVALGEATLLVPAGWSAQTDEHGTIAMRKLDTRAAGEERTS